MLSVMRTITGNMQNVIIAVPVNTPMAVVKHTASTVQEGVQSAAIPRAAVAVEAAPIRQAVTIAALVKNGLTPAIGKNIAVTVVST